MAAAPTARPSPRHLRIAELKARVRSLWNAFNLRYPLGQNHQIHSLHLQKSSHDRNGRAARDPLSSRQMKPKQQQAQGRSGVKQLTHLDKRSSGSKASKAPTFSPRPAGYSEVAVRSRPPACNCTHVTRLIGRRLLWSRRFAGSGISERPACRVTVAATSDSSCNGCCLAIMGTRMLIEENPQTCLVSPMSSAKGPASRQADVAKQHWCTPPPASSRSQKLTHPPSNCLRER